jgi:transcriptional regulator with XRE-family HTH domain
MLVNEAIKFIMKQKGITQQKIADMLGLVVGQRVVTNKLATKNMTMKTALMFLDALDYELVIKPKTRGKRKEGEILITMDGEE